MMADFNYEAFLKDAKKEGYSDQEIKDALVSQSPSSYNESGLATPLPIPEALAIGGKYLYNAIQTELQKYPGLPEPAKPKSIQDRTFQRIEPTFNSSAPVTSSIQSAADNVIPIFTPAAQKEIADPIVMNGIRKSQLEGYIGQPLPTDPKLVESIVKGYQNKYGVIEQPSNTDLYSMGNVRPGEHEMGAFLGDAQNVPEPDYTSPAFMRKGQSAPQINPAGAPQATPGSPVPTNIPGTQNIGQINTKPAVEGGFQVDPANTPNVAQDIKGLENAALTPEESSNKESLAKKESNIAPTSEVEGGVRPRTIADIQARPEINPSLREHLARQEALLAGNEKYHKTLAREYETGNKIGPGQVFVPGLGNMDNSMYNTLGAEGRREAMEALKGGKAFGQVTLPGQGFNEEFSKNLENYSKHLSETIPVDLTTRKSRIAEGLAHTDNYKKLGKAMRIAGVAGLGMAVSDLLNAKNIYEAALRTGDIASDYLPFVGQFKQGMAPNEVGAPTLTPEILESQRQATLLGSPYRKSIGVPPPKR